MKSYTTGHSGARENKMTTSSIMQHVLTPKCYAGTEKKITVISDIRKVLDSASIEITHTKKKFLYLLENHLQA